MSLDSMGKKEAKKTLKILMKAVDTYSTLQFRWVCLKCGLINVTDTDISEDAKCYNCDYKPGFKNFRDKEKK